MASYHHQEVLYKAIGCFGGVSFSNFFHTTMNETKKTFRLSDFDISEKTAFFPSEPPLCRLPGDYFSSWEDTCLKVPGLLKTKLLRGEVDALPERQFNEDTLKTEPEWRRAYVLLTVLSQSYIWVEGEAGVVHTLPKKLAIPWCTVSEHVSLKPVGCYAATLLFNYRLRDPNEAFVLDNIEAVSTFTGTEDESWFYMVAGAVDLASIPGLKAIEHAYESMEQERDDLLAVDLENIAKSVVEMREAIKRMYERCDPKVFYLDIRPFQSGSKGIKAFPSGIIYEGVDSKPKLFHGASAGQSTSIPSFDVFLRAKHTGANAEFLYTMREYMPKKHKEFLETLEKLPSVRDYVMQSKNSELKNNYDLAVEAFSAFRSEHIILVAKYIVMQKKHSVNASLDMTGTGGTPFMEFLKEVRNDTSALKL